MPLAMLAEDDTSSPGLTWLGVPAYEDMLFRALQVRRWRAALEYQRWLVCDVAQLF